MKDSDFDTFSEAWSTAYEMTGNCKAPTPRAINMAFDVLSDLDLDAVLKALSSHVRDPQSGQFQPKPADIVRAIEGTPDDAAMEAWGKVDQAVRRVGYGPHIVFDDPKIHKVLAEMGGFAQFGKATEDEMGYLRHAFTKRYAGCRDVTGYPAKIAGWHTDGQVRFIGDESRCQAVLERGSAAPVAITDASEVGAKLLEQQE